jgi:hypothetical protein
MELAWSNSKKKSFEVTIESSMEASVLAPKLFICHYKTLPFNESLLPVAFYQHLRYRNLFHKLLDLRSEKDNTRFPTTLKVPTVYLDNLTSGLRDAFIEWPNSNEELLKKLDADKINGNIFDHTDLEKVGRDVALVFHNFSKREHASGNPI